MNVAFDPWIPVVDRQGETRRISLSSVFANGGNISDLTVQPHERVALMRLFLCIAHAALEGPKDIDEWEKAPDKLPEAARKYLDKWKDSFDLFHEKKPWLQVADIKMVKDWTSVSKLNFAYATGNNTTLFDHAGMKKKRSMILEDIVVSMLAFQCFALSGTSSQVYWNDKQTKHKIKDAPCSPGSMYHAFLRGDNLLNTIVYNMVTLDDLQRIYGHPLGRPVWEKMPSSFDDEDAVQNATQTYVGRMVPIARLIKLDKSKERMMLGEGLVYPTFANGFSPEPTATVVIEKKGTKEGRGILSFKPSKAVWRELAAIVVKRKANALGGPLCLQNIREGKGFDLLVAALARDQATIVETTESVFHIPEELTTPNGVAMYTRETANAEKVAGKLGWAVETWRKKSDGYWEKRLESPGTGKKNLKARLHSIATIHYWTAMEGNLSLLFDYIQALGSERLVPAKQAWRKSLANAAVDAYTTACSRETPRQIRAFSLGWRELMSIYGILNPKPKKSKESA